MYYFFLSVPADYKSMAKNLNKGAALDRVAALKSIMDTVLQLPVTPADLKIKIGGQNKTVNLINGSPINIIKEKDLTEISFEFMVPHTKYPFVNTTLNTTSVLKFLDAAKDVPLQFIVSRMNGVNIIGEHTNIKVTLEDYTITESADYGLDKMVSVTLKKYVPYSTKVLKEDGKGNATVTKTRG